MDTGGDIHETGGDAINRSGEETESGVTGIPKLTGDDDEERKGSE